MTHQAVICLGSNVERRRDAIDSAIGLISRIATVVEVSPGCCSPDVSGRGNDYLNVAVKCLTDLTIAGFTSALAAIESAGGRTAESKASGVMPIDIDLVIWDNDIVSPCDYARSYFQIVFHQLESAKAIQS